MKIKNQKKKRRRRKNENAFTPEWLKDTREWITCFECDNALKEDVI